MLTRACRSSNWSVRAGPPSGATSPSPLTSSLDGFTSVSVSRVNDLVPLVAQSLREQERVLENDVFLLQSDAPIFNAHIPEILTAVTGVDADDVRPSWAYKSSTPVTGTAARVGVGGTGRGVGVGGSGVAVGVWSGVAVGAGVAVGGGAVILWLPSRAPTMSAAIPTEMSRIMAPRATSSCRLCRQFIQTSALDPDPEVHTHRAHSAVTRGRVIRGGTPPSLAGSAA